ncbi:glycosyltransferase [Janibacter cremeus]|uniref:Glycosyltransferase involved in cell wall biosynthesis n=1 Tax=Janibacter cremeus TaxID=1285192 RepID=A0A852VSS9_9MICO|nr:glycosyltransferase involved in cell wall biosynthesis [Janibacter cremeus]
MSTPIGSIIIAAHDEEAVIARALRHLCDIAQEGLVDVIVVCNGCRDRTAQVAREFSRVRVRELPQASKTAALREGDRIAVPGPRVYLDADVEMTGRAAVATLRALTDGALAGRPPRRFETARAHWSVRRWYAVRERLPSISGTLWGSGCYGLSVEGRARFAEFPEVIADDLFIDSLFTMDEVTIIATDAVVVHTPLRPADLLMILRRRYRTQEGQWVEAGPGPLSPGQRRQLRDLRALIRREPARIGDVVVYSAMIVLARLRARFGPSPRWERDTSSRELSE